LDAHSRIPPSHPPWIEEELARKALAWVNGAAHRRVGWVRRLRAAGGYPDYPPGK